MICEIMFSLQDLFSTLMSWLFAGSLFTIIATIWLMKKVARTAIRLVLGGAGLVILLALLTADDYSFENTGQSAGKLLDQLTTAISNCERPASQSQSLAIWEKAVNQ